MKKRWKHLELAALVILAILFVGEDVLLIANNVVFPKKPVLGLRINHRPMDGLSAVEAATRLEYDIKQGQPLRYQYHGQIFSVTPDDVGAGIDPRILSVIFADAGRQGSWWTRLLDQNQAMLGRLNLDLPGTLSKTLLAVRILDIQDQVNQPAVLAHPDFTQDGQTIIPEKPGTLVNADLLAVSITENIFHPPADPLPLPVVSVVPTHHASAAELNALAEEARDRTKEGIIIRYGGETLDLTPKQLQGLLTVAARPDPSNPSSTRAVLRMDQVKLDHALEPFANRFEQNTGAEFNEDYVRASIFAQLYATKRHVADIPYVSRGDVYALGGIQFTAKHLYALATAPTSTASEQAASKKRDSKEKVAYLTFDDGPNNIYHPMLLDILKKYHVNGTFFMVGQNVERFPDVTKRTLAEGNAIGNHTLTHAFLPKLSSGGIQHELQTTQDILQRVLGQKTTLFRPPYGGVNTTVRGIAKEDQAKLFLWDVDPRDWSEPPKNELVRRVLSHVHPGADILMHANHGVTVRALPAIIEGLKQRGYTFHLLSELKA